MPRCRLCPSQSIDPTKELQQDAEFEKSWAIHLDGCDDLFEVCCPATSTLAQSIEDKGLKVSRLGLHNDFDLSTQRGLQNAFRHYDERRPRRMWISTPCGPTSTIQRLNRRNDEQIKWLDKKIAWSRRIIRNVIQLCNHHLAQSPDHELAWEWPKDNDGWKLPEVITFFNKHESRFHEAILHGCRVGVKAENGEPIKKPWRIRTTSEVLARALDKRCQGCPRHAECLGNDRAARSAFYTPAMCRLVYKAWFPAKEIEHFAHAVEEMTARFSEEEFEKADATLFPVYAMTTENAQEIVDQMDPTERSRLEKLIRKLHVNSGHPANRVLERTLEDRRASPQARAICKLLRCSSCEELKRPTPHMPVTLGRCTELWHTLGMDLFSFTHPRTKDMSHILVLQDEASSYTILVGILDHPRDESRNVTAEMIIQAIKIHWIPYFGRPRVIRTDPEGALRSREFELWCGEQSIELLPTPGEDHSQLGTVASTVGIMRAGTEKMLQDRPDLTTIDAARNVALAHNTLERVRGFSPFQWALGRQPTQEGNLHLDNDDNNIVLIDRDLMTCNLDALLPADQIFRRY